MVLDPALGASVLWSASGTVLLISFWCLALFANPLGLAGITKELRDEPRTQALSPATLSPSLQPQQAPTYVFLLSHRPLGSGPFISHFQILPLLVLSSKQEASFPSTLFPCSP